MKNPEQQITSPVLEPYQADGRVPYPVLLDVYRSLSWRRGWKVAEVTR